MGIRYGRSLPPGPRPAAPRPKLGSVGPSRLAANTAARKRKKDAKQRQLQQPQGTSTSTTGLSGKAARKRAKQVADQHAATRQATSKQTASSAQGASDRTASQPPIRVVVIWAKGSFRYIAWGTKGIKALEGWKKCSSDADVRNCLAKLGRNSLRLVARPEHGDVVEIVDLIIMAGKWIPARKGKRKPAPAHPKPMRPRTKRKGAQPRRNADSSASGGWIDLSRHEALVTRSSGDSPSQRQRRKKPKRTISQKNAARARTLARQREELRRLGRLRNHGSDRRAGSDDLMYRAWQGGAPS